MENPLINPFKLSLSFLFWKNGTYNNSTCITMLS